jgi:2-oxoisovalerate dehydrogenase E2 component (dihydrolipoyl transacylase)
MMPTNEQFRLPDVGEGLTEAEILRWYVAVGDTIVVNQTIVEIETAKAAVELPSPYAGRVVALLVPAGATADVGTPIITIDTAPDVPTESGGDSGAVGGGIAPSSAPSSSPSSPPPSAADPLPEREALPAQASEFVPAPKPEREAVLVGYGVMSASATRRPRRAAGGSVHPVQPTRHGGLEVGRAVERALVDAPAGSAPVRSKPPVRKLAKDLGIDLAQVPGTGADGVVTRADVESFAGGTSAATASTVHDGHRLEPVKGVRKLMAEAMVSSAFTIPHVTEWVEVDVTRSVKLVDRLRQTPGFTQARVSPLLLVARAVLAAIKVVPDINACWVDDGPSGPQVAYPDVVNLGIAAATPRGLVVPNVKGADRLSLPELAVALGELVATAKAGRTTPADMTGGTFTITNIGVFGIDGGTPIINPGEGAILAVGAFREKPWVHKGRVRARTVAQLTVSFDHRFIDGGTGARFLAAVAAVLNDPAVPPGVPPAPAPGP